MNMHMCMRMYMCMCMCACRRVKRARAASRGGRSGGFSGGISGGMSGGRGGWESAECRGGGSQAARRGASLTRGCSVLTMAILASAPLTRGCSVPPSRPASCAACVRTSTVTALSRMADPSGTSAAPGFVWVCASGGGPPRARPAGAGWGPMSEAGSGSRV